MGWGTCYKKGHHVHQKSLTLRVVGFVGSLLFTLIAFFIIVRPDFFHLSVETAIVILLLLAVLQALVQCICFIHLWKEKGPPWNLIMFVSTICMVVIIIAFSIWIMDHLNYNMMGMP